MSLTSESNKSPKGTRRKVEVALIVVLGLPIVLLLGHAFIYEPLKFRRVISAVESAKTPEEERAAFALAARAGRVWELNRLRPQDLPDRARHIAGDWVLELEWMESSAWSGYPFRAYRRVLDTNNLEALWVRNK